MGGERRGGGGDVLLVARLRSLLRGGRDVGRVRGPRGLGRASGLRHRHANTHALHKINQGHISCKMPKKHCQPHQWDEA